METTITLLSADPLTGGSISISLMPPPQSTTVPFIAGEKSSGSKNVTFSDLKLVGHPLRPPPYTELFAGKRENSLMPCGSLMLIVKRLFTSFLKDTAPLGDWA